MKTLVSVISLLSTIIAYAAPTGSATLTVFMLNSNAPVNYNNLFVLQDGNRIYGHSDFSEHDHISLDITDGLYRGFVGEAVQLRCSQAACNGFIGAYSTDFNIDRTDGVGGTAMNISGHMNTGKLEITKTDNTLEIKTLNGELKLKRSADGVYRGTGYRHINRFDAELRLEGSLVDLINDPALIALLLASAIQ